MLLQFLDAIGTQSVMWIPYQQFINKIDGLSWPVLGSFLRLYLSLLSQDLVPDFLTVFSKIWSFSQHKLITHYTKCKIVNTEWVILATHDFRCHVARRTTGVISVVFPPLAWDSQVSQPNVAIRLQHKILRFNVSMNHFISMQILEGQNNAR